MSAAEVKAKGKELEFKIPGFAPRVSEKDLVTFTRQFATMIDAGLPLVQCLEILGSQSEDIADAIVRLDARIADHTGAL